MTKFIGQRALQERLNRGPTWIWAQTKNNPRFPKPVKENGRNLWIEAEVEAYQSALIAQRDGRPAAA
jgi:predicted DNA-binding transcriptional regulator AlpA